VRQIGGAARAVARKPFSFDGRPAIMGRPVVCTTDPALTMDSPRPAPGPPRQPSSEGRSASTEGRPASAEGSSVPGDAIDAASTIELLALVKEHQSEEAVNVLFGRYLPRITRWARGRLPRYARNMLDTDDLVQDTVFQTLKRLQSFEVRHEGALQGYLRTAVVNRIRDEVRRATRHPGAQSLHEDGHVDAAASPLEEAIGGQAVARYERAMEKLSDDERQAIVLRVELQLPYAQIAEEMRKPSPDAARMAVARALVRLAEEMGHEG
jgi:RNA polymerase sigma factor (sigma-70 family)